MWFDQARGFCANPQIDDPLFREFITKGLSLIHISQGIVR